MICDGTTASAGIDDDSAYHLSDESLKNHMETSRLSPFEEKDSQKLSEQHNSQ